MIYTVLDIICKYMFIESIFLCYYYVCLCDSVELKDFLLI